MADTAPPPATSPPKKSLRQVKKWQAADVLEWLRSSYGGRLQSLYAEAVCKLATRSGVELVSAGAAARVRALPPSALPAARTPALLAAIVALRTSAAAVTLQRSWRIRAATRNIRASIDRTNYRRCVAMEILTSEKKYLEQLCTATDNFLSPLPKDESVLTMTEVKTLFSDVAVIRAFSESLMETLQDRVSCWYHHQKIGDVFVKMSDYLRVYTEYVKNYEAASQLYQSFPPNHPFKKFYEQHVKNTAECYHRWPLMTFLITPVQRIPRYRLLLVDMLKHTTPEHVDYENLTKAVEKIIGIAEWVNENQKRYERMEKMVELQNSVSGLEDAHLQLIEASRQYVREGEVVEVIGRKKLKRRYLMLFSDIAVLCDSRRNESSLFRKSLTNSKMAFMQKIDLAAAHVRELDDTDFLLNAFEIIPGPGADPIILCLEQLSDKRAWLADWRSAAEKHKAHVKEMDEKTTRVAQARADQARAILSQQYTTLRMRTQEASVPPTSGTPVIASSTPAIPEPPPLIAPRAVDAKTQEERRQRRTSWMAKRGLTMFAMGAAEKWQIADEASEELARLRNETHMLEQERVERAKRNAESYKAALSQRFGDMATTARQGAAQAFVEAYGGPAVSIANRSPSFGCLEDHRRGSLGASGSQQSSTSAQLVAPPSPVPVSPQRLSKSAYPMMPLLRDQAGSRDSTGSLSSSAGNRLSPPPLPASLYKH